MKLCAHCSIALPLSQYNKCAATADGLHAWCRACQAAYNKSYSLKNAEKRRTAKAAWYQANKPRHRARQKVWADKNREKQRAAVARWAREHPEQKRETNRVYAKGHRAERNAARDAYRRANLARDVIKVTTRKMRKMRAMPGWANASRIRQMYERAQKLSRTTSVPWHVDHIVPLRNAMVCGLHVEANLQVIPAVANMKKGNRWHSL